MCSELSFTLQRKVRGMACVNKGSSCFFQKTNIRAHNSVETINWMHSTTVKALRTARFLQDIFFFKRLH